MCVTRLDIFRDWAFCDNNNKIEYGLIPQQTTKKKKKKKKRRFPPENLRKLECSE